ncbi:centrosomal protein of 68 kDa isoform X6 [Phalacrocorax aristotelis]|uniref:centrosomal protein of 68 kDa isoform X6 n=1 Tax=Phalacrocorax aristotelis TaxID=126867 RepID=UPI003F4B3F26
MRARGLASSCRRSSVPMAVDVGKSLSEASLSRQAQGDGRWDCAEMETDYPELADSLRRLLGSEEAKPCPQGTKSVAMSRCSRLTTGVTQGDSSYRQEVSSASASRFPRARASLLETETLIYRAADSDVPRHVSHQFLSSEEQQQVKASGCWEAASSPPSRCSSAEESSLAGACHDARASRQSRRLGAQSPFSSTPEPLRPQTQTSPESALRSRSASSFSTLSSEENGLSEEPSQSLLASTDVRSPAATAARDLCCRWGAAEGRAPRAHKLFSPLLHDHSTVDCIREMSSYQADYWACAIPDSLPPSPDRHSPHWNPNKEYEDLLDYAYPLKPRYKLGKMPEPFFRDSGIGLDSFSLSPEGTSRSTSIYSRSGQAQGSGENGRRRFMASAERFSIPGPGKRGCSGAGSYDEPLPIEKASFAKSASSHPSRGLAKDVTRESAGPRPFGHPAVDGGSWCSRGTPFPNYKGQMFCCQLEELIRWLYNVADITNSWVPASPDAESLKASLQRCLEFRKDVASHRSLTESVLERGEALLDCMASNSPALKDTLGLIAKQSEELETHAEHLYESILAAVGPMEAKDGMEDEEGVQQTAAQWVLPLSDLGGASQSRDG